DGDVLNTSGALYVANCRFRVDAEGVECITAFGSSRTILRNCEILSPPFSVIDRSTQTRQCQMENCLILGCDGVGLDGLGLPHDLSIAFKHTSFVGGALLIPWAGGYNLRALVPGKIKPIPVQALGNIFDAPGPMLHIFLVDKNLQTDDLLARPTDLLAMLPQ